MITRILKPSIAALAAVVFASCANQGELPTVDADGNPINPHPPGTYEHFKAEPSYPKTHSVWKNEELLRKTDASNSHIVINLPKQRGMLMNGSQVVIDYPITSGKRSHPTPTGEFTITEKVVKKSSNKYGTIRDADGKTVVYPADITKHEVPEGGEFIGSPMNYWMRLTNCGVGLHVGPMRRYPASHGCIRGPSSTHPTVYSKVKVGTRVIIE
jgi:lipoprotein-anchoring transpeptidase ErfK/SrfK